MSMKPWVYLPCSPHPQKENYDKNSASFQNKIILALAHLRNQEPDKAFVAIGPTKEWRKWSETRPPWTFIASHIFKLNNDTEKYLVLERNLSFDSFSRAETESFKVLFPEPFKKD